VIIQNNDDEAVRRLMTFFLTSKKTCDVLQTKFFPRVIDTYYVSCQYMPTLPSFIKYLQLVLNISRWSQFRKKSNQTITIKSFFIIKTIDLCPIQTLV